ncbi:MAG: hypothetical protein WBV39_13345 [Rudaea sp.]
MNEKESPGQYTQTRSESGRHVARSGKQKAGASNWREIVVGNLAMLAARPLFGVLAASLLLFGGMFLAVAWQLAVQPLVDASHYAPFTARTSGRIVESWAALEFHPDAMPKGILYWQPRAKIEHCEVVEFAGDWGAPLRRAFCGNHFQFRDDFRLDDWKTLAPGIPFAFARDASGFSVGEIRMDKQAFDWLSSHAPNDTFLLSKPPPTTALAALKEQFDKPQEMAVAGWSRPMPTLALAYDPKHPELAMPAKIVDERRTGFWFFGIIIGVLFAVPGVLVWRAGVNILFIGQSAAVVWVLTLLLLLALPWWGDVLPRIVAHANPQAAEVVSDMLDDMTRTTRLIASRPDEASQAHGERMVWNGNQGAYADTFGRVGFRLPVPSPQTADAARAALSTQARKYVAGLDSVARVVLFKRLRQLSDASLNDVQNLFAAAAEDTLRDANANAAAHKAAKDFLILASGDTYYEDQLDKLEVPPRIR